MKRLKYILILSTFLLLGCKYNLSKLPKDLFYQYDHDIRYEFSNNDTLVIDIKNHLKCPMRIWIQSKDDQVKSYFREINPITLRPLRDTVLAVKIAGVKIKELNFASRFGDINKKVNVSKVELPFQKNKSYPLVQGYNSLPTHNNDLSRYAFDFGLAIGDTICAATKGFVVGVIDGYKYGGYDSEWRNYANCITIYDPHTGLFTQYVHLDYKGSLVQVGDSVVVGQNIGISGMTGLTNVAHLHFNCLKPIHSEDGLISIPLDSIGQYKISEMKRNEMIKNMN